MEATALGLDQKKYKDLSWALKGFGVGGTVGYCSYMEWIPLTRAKEVFKY